MQDRKRNMPGRHLPGLVLAACLAMAAVIPAQATKKDVEEAREKAHSLEAEKKKVEETLQKLESLKSDVAAYVKELDASLHELDQELEGLEAQIGQKEADIAKADEELAQARQVEAKQYDAMKLRIKYMYEQGKTSYLDMLFQSESLVQMMNRAEYIQKISQYDRQKMEDYEAAKEAVEVYEERLTREHSRLLDLQGQTEAKRQSMEILLAQKNQELKNFESQIDSTQDQISAYEKDILAQEAKVKQLEEEIRRKEEEARKAAEEAGKRYNTVSLGNIKFIWPCPSSKRVTSGFGGRVAPTQGASTQHQGIDIGAASGSAIQASAAGTVVIATYSYSAGNYIMVNHGGGVFTVYMHCSQLLASEGQQVSQGQTIAKVGSTGYSTGPHLHFGIRAGGKYVDPADYVSP